MPTFIPGYLGTVTLNADNISTIGSVVSLTRTRNVMSKPVFGSPYAYSLGGQRWSVRRQLVTFRLNSSPTWKPPSPPMRP